MTRREVPSGADVGVGNKTKTLFIYLLMSDPKSLLNQNTVAGGPVSKRECRHGGTTHLHVSGAARPEYPGESDVVGQGLTALTSGVLPPDEKLLVDKTKNNFTPVREDGGRPSTGGTEPWRDPPVVLWSRDPPGTESVFPPTPGPRVSCYKSEPSRWNHGYTPTPRPGREGWVQDPTVDRSDLGRWYGTNLGPVTGATVLREPPQVHGSSHWDESEDGPGLRSLGSLGPSRLSGYPPVFSTPRVLGTSPPFLLRHP